MLAHITSYCQSEPSPTEAHTSEKPTAAIEHSRNYLRTFCSRIAEETDHFIGFRHLWYIQTLLRDLSFFLSFFLSLSLTPPLSPCLSLNLTKDQEWNLKAAGTGGPADGVGVTQNVSQ